MLCTSEDNVIVLYSRYKKSIEKKEKRRRSLSRFTLWSRSHIYIYIYIQSIIIVSLCCATISNINETKRAYCSILHMYIYIYYTAIENTLVSLVCSCQQGFCNKDETSLACASIFHTNIAKNLLENLRFRYFIGEKKKEREIKKKYYNASR